ncbi:putative Phosphopantetheinyl transferase [Vibrio nigripulchritudo SFn27]|uniref:Putative Phosphopantetheinyl transferase n=2 Tax=Vibrio nigripulchritudo TaxID=28173 RepID=U4KEG9_9VIBR|nr:putative Phosphopantetheinyl transferase [Vibrio nigripulchritudo BLFn1]CCN87361.1 putative Phosphopantetheinyl transferase [Vibrio nigripulchritudo SFn27]CCN94740.1 putative Phosphopantetheinyl transferase [Vibrio nigripulchritudo ENn2]CCO40719.1 putative Phosphopantetheinyl transferase [Vibrio nigripulchritudo SFn135]CCO54796.1 putative Phosphopantetheinyl transferase [Vibrio nigripulchritudo Wn13]CCO57298.1 putative Phosphopantetheinyl transferase [Vibrio nigripulchritudo]
MPNSKTIGMEQPQPDEAHVWLWLPSQSWVSQYLDDLSDSERTQYELKSDKSRWQFASSKLFQRHVLSLYTGLSPKAHQISKSTYGKPFLEGYDLKFNASHSQKIMVVGITCRCEIGIDIAVHNHASRWRKRANHILHKTEVAKDSTEFYNLWALKESLLKATGDGLVHGCHHLALQPCTEENSVLKSFRSSLEGWHSYLLEPPTRHASLALSSSKSLTRVRIMCFVTNSN